MTPRLRPFAFAFVGLVALSAGSAVPQAQYRPSVPVRIEIRAAPIPYFEHRNPERIRFGALEFRGGLVLASSYEHFGGLSGLHVAPDGEHFLSLSDKGHWLRGRIIYDGDRATGIADAEMAPILGPDGRPLWERGWYDTESLAVDGGTLYVGIEKVHQIVRFDYGKDGLLARGQPIPLPPGVRTLPSSKGLEALAFVPKGMPLAGTLVAISEHGLDASGNLKAFLIGGPSPGDFTVKRSDDYDATDAAITPAGELLLLERRFSILRGAGLRIRRIPLGALKPGALVDGEILIDANLAYEIDNMEGIAVHRNAAGETILTLISDDNFNPLQRTILLRFALIGR
ncbi:MAG: esterase-like activity of phytase family protein [Xanthobacteraceae bacterium]|nr:esterase-like activity of phytase family protein [Xanthobacteraceae bacterium]